MKLWVFQSRGGGGARRSKLKIPQLKLWVFQSRGGGNARRSKLKIPQLKLWVFQSRGGGGARRSKLKIPQLKLWVLTSIRLPTATRLLTAVVATHRVGARKSIHLICESNS